MLAKLLTRPALEIALTLVTVAGVTGWWHARDHRIAAEARAAVIAERADSVAQAATDSLAARDSIAARRVRAEEAAQARLRAAADSARQRASREARRASTALQRAREATARDSVARAAVDSLDAAHRRVEGQQMREIQAKDSIIASLHVVVGQWEDRGEAWKVSDRAKDALIAALRTQGHADAPGFMETWGGRAIAVGIGAALGYLAGR
jgi:uncharacterized protein YhaN